MLALIPQVSLSALPVVLLLLGALIFLLAERIRGAIVAQTRQQRAVALQELAFQRELHGRAITYDASEALLALRQIIYDAIGNVPPALALAAVGQNGVPLVLRDALQQYYALTPHADQAHALIQKYTGRVIELTPTVAGVFVADELAAAYRALAPAGAPLPRGVVWQLVIYDPTPNYRLERRPWWQRGRGKLLPG